jgi:tRNA(Ile)-lysidine synthase
LPASARVARIAAALQAAGPVVATLAGARIEAHEASVSIFREAGEAARGGLSPVRPPAVWDGRFEITEGREVRRLAGLIRQLPPEEQAVLKDIPPAARGALPVLVDGDGVVRLAPLHSLVCERFRAAAGLIQREPA